MNTKTGLRLLERVTHVKPICAPGAMISSFIHLFPFPQFWRQVLYSGRLFSWKLLVLYIQGFPYLYLTVS